MKQFLKVLDDNTLVIFTSDNGPQSRTAPPLRGAKGTNFEGGVREPCIMRWPGKIPAGKTCNRIVGNIDMLSTFAKLVGVEPPKDRVIDGRDITSLLLDPHAPPVRDTHFYVSGTPLDNTAAVFVHPGIAHSQSEIQFVREKLAAKSEPWKSDWERLRESQYAALKRKPSPQSHVERGVNNHPDIGSSELIGDGNAAYTHALIWALTDDAVHAKKAAEILNAWSHKLEQISNHDAKLLVGMIGHHYCNAAELVKHSRANWPKDHQVQFEAMLRNIFYPIIKDFYPSANRNWDASMLQTMIAMGIYLDDRAMFDRAVAYFRTGEGNGSIRNYFNAFGECQESGRDQAHTQMGLEFLANTCEAAWHQGIDL